MSTYIPPQPNGMMASAQPMMPPAMAPAQMPQPMAPQQPPAPDPRAWAKSWKRPLEWTDSALIEKFNKWDKTDNAHWSEWKTEARTNYDMVAGRQLPEEAKQENEEKGLVAITINKIDATISAVSGSEMSNQQETKYYPRETSTRGQDGRLQDVAVSEVLTGAADWVRDETDQGDEESESFRDCLICGIGVTEGRMDYDIDPEGMAVPAERCDPLEFRIDSSARRPNAADARRITREKAFGAEDAKDRFGDKVSEGGKQPSWERTPHANDPGQQYKGSAAESSNRDDVWICEYQWWELEKVHKVLNPMTGQLEELTEQEFQRLIVAMPEFEQRSASIKVRRYYRAFRCGNEILEVTPLPDEEFTYKFITGKLDRNKGVWYGLVRAMVDPQRLLNKQISQTQRIVDTNAKGGLVAETDAFEDQAQAESDWAASDTIVWAKPGAIAGGKVIPKPISPTPQGIDKLLMIAESAIPSTSGVNAEMMGNVDRQQAGVVDVQRKEAAYGVLQSFFRSLKRYRKQRGRHTLKLITRYMTDNRLIRITGRNGNVQYIPLAKQPDAARYDVIVDESPTGPNQKDKVFQYLMMFGGPLLSKLNLPPQVWLKFLEFSPLPSALVQEVMQAIEQMPPAPDPNAQKMQAEQQQAQAKLQMEGQKAQADAQIRQAEAQASLQIEQMKAAMNAQTERQKADMQAEQAARQAQIDAAIERVKAESQARIEAEKLDRQMALEQWKAQQDQAMAERQFAFEAKMQAMEMAFNQRLAEQRAMTDARAQGGATNTQFGGDVG